MTTKLEWLQEQKNKNPDKSLYDLLSYLNTKQEVDNPEPIFKVLKVPTFAELLAVFGNDFRTRAKIQASPIWGFILNDINNGRHEFFQSNLENLLGLELITQKHFDDISLLLSQQIDDPNYQSKVFLTPAEQAGFDVIATVEITEVFK